MLTISSITVAATWWQKIAPKLLAASWGAGMFLGCAAANFSNENLAALIRQSVVLEASITGLLAATTLPFLFSAVAVSFSEPWLLLLISTFKAFTFSYCAWGVCLSFGQSAWLVLFLFLFSDLCLAPVQYYYWLRHIRGNSVTSALELPLFIVAALLVGSIDYLFVSPFLASLMK